MNENNIATNTWSNIDSKALYEDNWPNEPELRQQYEEGQQCGGCSFFAPFNADWGLCGHAASRHHLETVFEHFTCTSFINEGWGPHSFTEDASLHCRCGGESSQ
ncbi:high-potential iron-sulfur protein [Aeoliella sp.]|uniref:high-potential iron-sulfur protein n=1 Tax=Aeoliella sp. TaxID=2795800 RepID=UPI003CCBC1B6